MYIVYTARSFYKGIFRDTVVFNDDSICSGRQTRMKREPEAKSKPEKQQTADILQKQVLLYPNPADDKLYVMPMLEYEEYGTLELYNIMGVKVAVLVLIGNTLQTLPTGNMPAGLYAYSVKTSKGYMVKGKLIIAR